MLNHGGKLQAASLRYRIPLSDWIDLSTGVNPQCYPVPAVPAEAWNRLPEDEDGLLDVAREYYQCTSLLPVAGTQAAIQSLPLVRRQLFPDSKTVAIPAVGYREHYHAWHKQGYEILTYQHEPTEQQLQSADVILVINPNNPTGHRVKAQTLLQWSQQLAGDNRWLLVDEAFIDCTPEHSISSKAPQPGLIILRSVGKFFGLAGIRMGFVLADDSILKMMQEILGPWTVSGPARIVCRQALADTQWQHKNREYLTSSGLRLQQLISQHFADVRSTPLFVTAMTGQAVSVHEALCQQGIFTRLLDEHNGVRFGLPATEAARGRLAEALKNAVRCPLPAARCPLPAARCPRPEKARIGYAFAGSG